MSRFLRNLTAKQAEAATLDGSVLVLAGAGTGKTRTLTAAVVHRIAERGIPASRIVAVTFTNKAAAEMLSRIRTALGDAAPPPGPAPFTDSTRASCASSRKSGICGLGSTSSTPTTPVAWSSG